MAFYFLLIEQEFISLDSTFLSRLRLKEIAPSEQLQKRTSTTERNKHRKKIIDKKLVDVTL